MGLFESEYTKNYKKQQQEKKDEELRDIIRNSLGLEDVSSEDVDRIQKLIKNLGADQIINFPQWHLHKTSNSAEKQMMLWKWLEVRQNWLILNQLSKLNNNIEKLLKNNE